MHKPGQPLLEVQNLRKSFRFKKGFITAVEDVSFSMAKGEVLGLVGESGCGKTTCAKACIGMLKKDGGTVRYGGRDIDAFDRAQRKAFTREVQYIFQDPYTSLDPRMCARELIAEGMDAHGLTQNRQQREDRISQLLQQVGLRPAHGGHYPHEFSGGQRQRIGIARALAVNPQLLLCDEPISALDVSVQAQIMNLLVELRETHNLSYLFISHDITMVRYISDRIAVFYMGRIVEIGAAAAVYEHPAHPYTRSLLAAVPVPDPVLAAGREPALLSGEPPGHLEKRAGCMFRSRCPHANEDCGQLEPVMQAVEPGHEAMCSRLSKIL